MQINQFCEIKHTMTTKTPESKQQFDVLAEILTIEGLDPDNAYPPSNTAETLAGLTNDGTGVSGQNHKVKTISEKLRVDGARVTYEIDALEGTDLSTANWIQMDPGYVGIAAVYKVVSHFLAREGFAVARMGNPPRTQHGRGWLPRNLLHPDFLLAEATSAITMHAHNKYQAAGIDMIGHSMGFPAVSKAARHVTKQYGSGIVNSVTGVMPAGCTDISMIQTGKNALAMGKYEIAPNSKLLLAQLALGDKVVTPADLVKEAGFYVLRNPVRTMAEGLAVSYHCDARPGLTKLGEMGVRTAVIGSIADLLFPHDEMKEYIAQEVDLFVSHDDPETSGHIAPFLYPQATARLIAQTLRKLQASEIAA
jgi:hypothetical protein